MSLLSSEPTQLDLSWRMFGIPVRVSPWFWLTAAFLGWSSLDDGFDHLLVWIACVFVSILLHEMGHVLVGRLFGSDGHILLCGFGGLAFGSNDLPRRWQRIAVSLAGPGIQFVLLGAVYLVGMQYVASHLSRVSRDDLVWEALRSLFFINLFWPLLNLLPIWPLDGGQVSRELCEQVSPRNGVWFSLGISFLVSAVLALNALASMWLKRPLLPWFGVGSFFTVFFFALFAAQSWTGLQEIQARGPRWDDEDDHLPWEQDADAWKRGR